jgi:AraC family transcriptional regulator, activator of mtrCDE
MILLETLLTDLDVCVEPFALCDVHGRWEATLGKKGFASVHYVLKGRGTISVRNGTELSVKEGSMVIIPAGVRLWIEPDGAAAQGVATAISCQDLPEGWRHVRTGSGRHGVTLACGAIRVTYQQSVGLFDYLREPIIEDFSDSPEVHRVFAELLREMAEPQPGSRMIIESLLQRCLVILLRRHCASGRCELPWLSALENPKLGRAIATILDRPEAPHTLSSLAQTAGMSRSAFAQQFTAAFGRPAIAFLCEIRLRRAARHLEITDLAVKAVAAAAGFRSRSYFWRAFKALYGIDPAHFRTKRRAILASRAAIDSDS